MSPDSEYSSEGPRALRTSRRLVRGGWLRAGERVSAACRVSCAGRARETLAPCGTGQVRTHGARGVRRRARRLSGRRGSGCRGGRGEGPAGLVERRDAFLAPEGRSKRFRGSCARGARGSLARAEARDRPRVRILSGRGRNPMNFGHRPLRPTATIFGVASPLWGGITPWGGSEGRSPPNEIRIPGSFSKSPIWRRNPARARDRLPASSGWPASQTCAVDSEALRSKATLHRPPPGETEG